ncbi:F0F1 ATP synthase subunit epsilon [Paenibacillus campi]|uniref:F0F1 ATP synthase subunit epsilon n=1 Tax=Paenibacillus campi TaxID=3106031 RepID=UPI002AFF6F32|nr:MULTISPECIES: F0F1 ATP synthase subunit epsilon [unclassified Paenibacillus]
MNTFLLEIVTPERLVFSEQVERLVATGIDGDMGVLAGHIPTVTPLKVAPLVFQAGGKRTTFAIQGGFLEVRPDKVVVLAESAEKSSNIDVERARAAKERAERRLHNRLDQDHIDFRRAELALQRAMNRIKVSSSGENR